MATLRFFACFAWKQTFEGDTCVSRKAREGPQSRQSVLHESAFFMYSNAVRVPSLGSALSGSYSMFATYLNLIFFSSIIVLTIGVEPCPNLFCVCSASLSRSLTCKLTMR